MLRANITKINRSSLQTLGARPLTRQPPINHVRTVMYKHDSPDHTTSTLVMTPKTWGMIGGLLAVAGGYGYMMGKPYKVIGSEHSPASIQEKTSQNMKKP